MSIVEKAIRYSMIYRVSSHILFWLVVFIVPQYQTDMSIRDMLIQNLFYVSFYMMASYFVAYFIIPKFQKGEHYLIVIFYFIMGSYLISATSRIMVVYMLEPLIRTPPYSQEPIVEILTDLRKLITVYFIQNFSLAWIFGFIKLAKNQYLTKQHTLQLEKEKAEAELNALKAQLNPHFLFNTLNNIYSLSLVNSPITSSSIAGLAEILDHILYRCNSNYVPISTEVNLLENYIALEKIRYDKRLNVSFDHTIEQDVQVVPLILLSILENAFKHGAGEDIGDPRIAIDLTVQAGTLKFKVENTFVGQKEHEYTKKIGMSNISKQLALAYTKNHEFRTYISDGRFVTLLTISNLTSDDTRFKGKDTMSFS
ncbi:sensor histidine kinase [Sphingobacterium sp. DR205]|uniref:sensor histidine kinase n=1 Tax=Sphingobacterium sp. DR205 TaxID=2713573 RepID=UPI0013E48758|nr:sensor histidine kinase [Sphingobacterium sp. DR205]QIH32733.1 histidine kinase [Sphingobacterium sp. DR205]